MAADSLSGAVTLESARRLSQAAHAALEARKQQVNDLNVYPVPDGDTGTNLLLTVRGVVTELSAPDAPLEGKAVCDKVANAALMGARGNSGVILSQIVRGAMEALSETGSVDATSVVKVFRRATDTAYRAVRKPVEGTMLTVLRETTEAGERAGAIELPELLGVMIRAGWESVEKTPTLLKVLADAGVVDAGGYGLMVILEGLFAGVTGAESGAAEALFSVPGVTVEDVDDHEGSLYTYCTTFLLDGEALDGPGLERLLEPLGDSLLVVGSETRLKVHVHTDEPGTVLGHATARGVLHQVSIDNMKTQTAERDERLRTRPTPVVPVGETQVVAVVAGDGIHDLFVGLGVGLFVEGGQSMNPSAEEIMAAVARAEAPGVIILPNNKNIIMAAEQVAALADKPVSVLPTKSMQAGLSAMVAFDASAPLERNLAKLTEALEQVPSGEITMAVRDSRVDGVDVREGAYIGLVEGRLVASGEDMFEVARGVTERLLVGEREVVTVLIGADDAAASAHEVVERLRDVFPDADFEAYDGGQPLYPLMLSAE